MKTGAVTLGTRSYQKPKQKRKSSYEKSKQSARTNSRASYPAAPRLLCGSVCLGSCSGNSRGYLCRSNGLSRVQSFRVCRCMSATRFLKSSTGEMRRSWPPSARQGDKDCPPVLRIATAETLLRQALARFTPAGAFAGKATLFDLRPGAARRKPTAIAAPASVAPNEPLNLSGATWIRMRPPA